MSENILLLNKKTDVSDIEGCRCCPFNQKDVCSLLPLNIELVREKKEAVKTEEPLNEEKTNEIEEIRKEFEKACNTVANFVAECPNGYNTRSQNSVIFD